MSTIVGFLMGTEGSNPAPSTGESVANYDRRDFIDGRNGHRWGLVPMLALAVKCVSLARIAGTLVETYLGRDAGRRVLNVYLLEARLIPVGDFECARTFRAHRERILQGVDPASTTAPISARLSSNSATGRSKSSNAPPRRPVFISSRDERPELTLTYEAGSAVGVPRAGSPCGSRD